jgi:hypothetical protein
LLNIFNPIFTINTKFLNKYKKRQNLPYNTKSRLFMHDHNT